MGQRMRRTLAVVLVVLTSVSSLVAALGVWTDTNVLDSTRFAAKGSEILARPEVADAVAARLTDQTFALLSRITNRDLDGRVADTVRTAIHDRLAARIEHVDTVRITYPALLATHRAVARSIEGDQQAVTLDLLPLMTTVLGDLKDLKVLPSWLAIPDFTTDTTTDQQILQLSRALRIELPEDFGRVTLIESDPSPAVGRIRDLLRVFHDVVTAAVIAAIVLAMTAMVVSPRRPRTLVHLGMGTCVAWIIGVVAVDGLREFVTAMITSTDRDAVEVALRLFLATWTDLSIRLILFGVGLSAIGIMLDIRSGLRFIPALVGVAVAATLRLTPLALGLGLVITIVGLVLIRVTGVDRPTSTAT